MVSATRLLVMKYPRLNLVRSLVLSRRLSASTADRRCFALRSSHLKGISPGTRSFTHSSPCLNTRDSSSSIQTTGPEKPLATSDQAKTELVVKRVQALAMPVNIMEGGKYVAHLLKTSNESGQGIQRAVVFVRSKLLAEDLALQLMEYGLQADALTARTGGLLEELFTLPETPPEASEDELGEETVTESPEEIMNEKLAFKEQILQRFIAGEFNILITSEDESKGMILPKVDMIVQVQQCFKSQLKSLYYMKSDHYSHASGKAVILYNNDDLKFLSSLQQQIEIQKILPPSFYNEQDFSFTKREKSTEKDVVPYDEEPLIPKDFDEAPRILSMPVKSKKIPKFDIYSPKVKLRVSDRQPMSDFVRLYVRGGTGGQGCQRSGMVGGDGGDVIFQCRPGATLDYFRVKENRRLLAGNGTHCITGKNYGPKKLRYKATRGERGRNLVVPVPEGTIIRTEDGEDVAELLKPHDTYIVSQGGRGGSAFNPDWNGEKGENTIVRLELKLIADIGLVGFPNAGKSSLLGSLTRARPRVGDFAFTSVRPSLGVLQYPDHNRVTIADLPGLLEGAHLNKGLGIRFLKHVERTGMLIFVIDIGGFQLNYKCFPRNPFENLCILMKELELYSSGLSSVPKVLVVNKMDTDGAEEKYQDLMRRIEKVEDEENLSELIFSMDAQGYEMETRKKMSEDYYEKEFTSRLEKLKQFNFQGIYSVSTLSGSGLDELKKGIKELFFSEDEKQRKYSSYYF